MSSSRPSGMEPDGKLTLEVLVRDPQNKRLSVERMTTVAALTALFGMMATELAVTAYEKTRPEFPEITGDSVAQIAALASEAQSLCENVSLSDGSSRHQNLETLVDVRRPEIFENLGFIDDSSQWCRGKSNGIGFELAWNRVAFQEWHLGTPWVLTGDKVFANGQHLASFRPETVFDSEQVYLVAYTPVEPALASTATDSVNDPSK